MTDSGKSRVVTVAVCTALLSGCGEVLEPGLSAADERAIRGGIDLILAAANRRDFAAWSELYTEDAVIVPPDGPAVEGRSAIHQWLSTMPSTSGWNLRFSDVEGRDDLAFVRGAYALRSSPEGEGDTATEEGRVVQIWRKQDDGSWKALREIFNPGDQFLIPQ